MEEFDAAIKVIAETCNQLERTLLYGWPFDTYPTDIEAQMIEATFHELGLHEPGLPEHRRWYLAGQIVARFRRDVSTSAVRDHSEDVPTDA